MLGRRYRLFSILGVDVGADASWLIISCLVTWTLAQGVFPRHFQDLEEASYWLMGLGGTIGLFFSIVFHELSHAIVARRIGIRVHGITLFLIGGIAEMEDEPSDPISEISMAAAGPVGSLLIGLVLLVASAIGYAHNLPVPLSGTLEYLGSINVLLALFNLLPAFPLDGGRILRAILWLKKKDIARATLIAAKLGVLFGHLFFAVALMSVLTGDYLGAVWWALIGFFVRRAARASYQASCICNVCSARMTGPSSFDAA
jgi:Zn-dependent protease